MAYDREELIKKALDLIEPEQVTDLGELAGALGISKTTLYAFGLNELDEIKEAIDKVKRTIFNKMRRKWRDSENATLQIAEARLLSTDEQLERLTINRVKQDNTHKFDQLPKITFDVIRKEDTGSETVPG
jgi:hypothetical protein